jgi:ABC-2 type transport system ATP-binding protein
VCGHDVATDPAAVRRVIGLVGQDAAVDELLPARDNLLLFGRLRGLRGAALTSRASELLEMSGWTSPRRPRPRTSPAA